MTEPRALATSRRLDWPRVAAVVLAVLGLLWLLAGLASLPGGEGWGYDYRAYHDAAVRLDRTGSLYQDETLLGPYRPGPYGLYMYAPPLGLAVVPLTGLPLETGITLWYLLHVAALAGACLLMPVGNTIRLAAFGVVALSLAVTRDLVLGNVSVPLLLLMAVAWRWLDRPLGSVAQAAALSIRPMLGVLLFWQALRRRWAAVAWTLGAGLILVALTVPFVGASGYAEYLRVIANLSDVTGVERNSDLSSTVLGLTADQRLASLSLLAGYAIALGAILMSLRRDAEVGFVVTASASLLLSPLLWDHYLVMLVLPAALVADRGRPIALVLPLLSWLPPGLLPIVTLIATLLPLWPSERAQGAAVPVRSPL